MEQIREALFALKMDVLRKRQLLAQLESLREQEQALQQRVSFLAEQMAAEQQDVERLEGRSLARLFHYMSGKYEQRLDQEKQEAYEAAVRYETACQELDDAASMGVWDLLGGGLLVTMAKHDHLDAAQNLVEQLQIKLHNFKTELVDVSIDVNLQMQVDGFLYFADYFFDGIFADLAVQNHIEEQQRQIHQLKQQIDVVLGTLETMGTDLEQQKQQLQQSRNRLALQY